MSDPRSAPHSKSAPRSVPHSTSKSGKSRCIKNAICPVCHKKFVLRVKVTEHMREHHTSFKFICSFCERQYDTYNGQVKQKKSHGVIHVEIVEVSSSSNFS